MQRYASNVDYANWLTPLPWDFWATCTTGYEMTLPTARRSMGRFHKFLQQAGPTKMFWAAEDFDCKEGYHTHALLKVPDALQFKNVVDMWQKASGGLNLKKWQRIDLQKYNPTLGAGYYIAKYVSKKITDYDFLI